MQHWFTYPNIDPVAFRLGPLAVHWYGLSYLAGFLAVGAWMGRAEGRKRLGLSYDGIQDFLVYALVGVLIGGRLFFVIADIVTKHDASLYFGDMPRSLLNVIAVWNGGMGFFGGLIGVAVAIALFIRKHPWLSFGVLADEVVVLLPVGLALTRIVNFINDELVGNLCVPDHPWCIKFPSADGYRYPSQLFEALMDIAVLPIVYLRLPPASARRRRGVDLVHMLRHHAFACGDVEANRPRRRSLHRRPTLSSPDDRPRHRAERHRHAQQRPYRHCPHPKPHIPKPPRCVDALSAFSPRARISNSASMRPENPSTASSTQ